MANYQTRNNVPAKYKWDLSFLLAGQTIEELMQTYEKIFHQLIKVKDTKYATAAAFLKALKLEDELMLLSNRVSNYLSNQISENVAASAPNQLLEKFQFLNYQLQQALGPETPRIFAHMRQIKTYLKDAAFAPYRRTYNRIFETKKHQLPKKIQEYRNQAARGEISSAEPFALLTDAELKFSPVKDAKGKTYRVGHDTITKLAKHKDQAIRKAAALSYQQGYLQVKQTLANFLFQHFKSVTVEAKLHHFPNTIAYLTYADRSNEKLLLAQYSAVQKHVPLWKKARAIHQKAYRAKYGVKMNQYDHMRPIVAVKSKLSIEEQQELVLAAFKPFGAEYTKVIQRAFAEHWIDYEAYPGKRTGAYSIGGTYGVKKKLILMNNDGDIRSAETLAHELGHSMHSYFADQKQHLRNSAYRIFVAEIASIFNELMFFDHMLKISTNKKLKLQILHQIITGFEGTVFRQTMWSNYEYDLYQAIEKGQPVSTYEAISKLYFKNAQKYSPKTLKAKDQAKIGYNAIRVPHYYYDFYVYKYAIGQIVAMIFFNRYLTQGEQVLKDYINNFLAMGDSLEPLALLKHNGIDLEDPATFEAAFNTYAAQIKEYGKLVKQVYGV